VWVRTLKKNKKQEETYGRVGRQEEEGKQEENIE
jgi:hypothetical protein